MRRFAAAVVLTVALALFIAPRASPAYPGQAATVPKPGPKDLCPVCGMIVAEYPNWVATVVWKNGSVQHFDGAKDLFKFLQALPKYAPGRKREDIRSTLVTEFYNLQKIDATKAFYVIGSDVMGPMGHELVPLGNKADAEEFQRDHRGKRILRYDEITPEIVAQVDAGRFN
ncbi:MAG TPA: nitrous oxide reductase accessory protein NosL [Bryobacteraceae bacterium]|jgi:nitrous oxide reductase accessory protein NosL|nr:nitrous oxide reductase accessory protein NosL [Bryobacteraceae bacterium]